MRTIMVTLCLLCAWTARAPAQSRPKDEEGIRTRVTAYVAAVNARDLPGLAAVFTPDADFILFDSPRHVGPEAIAKVHGDALASWPPTRKFSLEVTNIRFLGPELALLETIGRFSEGETRSNRGTILMARRSGAWQWAALRVYPAERS